MPSLRLDVDFEGRASSFEDLKRQASEKETGMGRMHSHLAAANGLPSSPVAPRRCLSLRELCCVAAADCLAVLTMHGTAHCRDPGLPPQPGHRAGSPLCGHVWAGKELMSPARSAAPGAAGQPAASPAAPLLCDSHGGLTSASGP